MVANHLDVVDDPMNAERDLMEVDGDGQGEQEEGNHAGDGMDIDYVSPALEDQAMPEQTDEDTRTGLEQQKETDDRQVSSHLTTVDACNDL